MRNHRALLSLLLPLALAGRLSGQSVAEASAGVALDEAGCHPYASFGLTTGFERDLGPDSRLSVDLDASGSTDLSDSSTAGNASLDMVLRRLVGLTNLGLELEAVGVLPSAADPGSATFALSLPIVFNGLEVSCDVAPGASIDILSDGYVSTWLEGGLSVLVGDLVLKPGLGFEILFPWSGGTAYVLAPRAELSWYPGFPLSASLSARISFGGDALPGDYLLPSVELLAVAAPSDLLLLTLKARGSYADSEVSLEASLESAFLVAGAGTDHELSLPLSLGLSAGEGLVSWSVGLGLRLGF